MNLRRFLMLGLLFVAVGCGSHFPQDVLPMNGLPTDAGSTHVRSIDVMQHHLDNARLRACGNFTPSQDGGSLDAGVSVDGAADAGVVVVLGTSIDAGVFDGGSSAPIVDLGSRGVLVAELNREALPVPCSNPGFEIFSQVMVGTPLQLSSIMTRRNGFRTEIQIPAGANVPVHMKFFCDMSSGSPILMGGDSDPACYTASLHTFFSELALYELSGNVVDMRVERRAITYIGKTRVSVTSEPVVPATFCVDGGH